MRAASLRKDSKANAMEATLTPPAPGSDTQANGTATTFENDDFEAMIRRRFPRVFQPDTPGAIRHQRERAQARERDVRTRRLRKLLDEVGCRYHSATLDNFRVEDDAQRPAIQSLRQYAAAMPARVDAGEGVVLLGPAGTGKDHLLVGLARLALLDWGLTVRAVDGMTLYSRLRDGIATGRPESAIIGPLVSAGVLLVSDPIPPAGGLTDYQRGILFAIVDERYRAMRPTWATINVTTGTEADDRLGASIVDRLRHGALVVRCNWPTFRRAAE
jgi:DNA replication protein DnaC